mmetsp:Transcript_93397/g.263651  ORF Transcript_93397/g.263651 Transcript_93397/m.263651 type:complete len:588 (-) Transcript_93397:123-1886(-)
MDGEAEDESTPMLPISTTLGTPSAYVVGGPLCSWRCFWWCVLPGYVVSIIVCSSEGWTGALTVLCGLPLVYVAVVVIIYLSCSISFQVWALQRPDNVIVRLLLPPVEVLQSTGFDRNSGFPLTWYQTQHQWGNNFCATGQVYLCSFDDVRRAITNPQARTYMLGEHPLLRANLPDTKASRCVFLLSLSDEGAGGNGDHEAFRACVMRYIFNAPEWEARMRDVVAESLFEELEADYVGMPHGRGGAFFTDGNRGLTPFVVKYLHYVLFGMVPGDDDRQTALLDFMAAGKSLTYYMLPFGHFMGKQKNVDEIAAMYEGTPAFQAFAGPIPEFHMMTKREMAQLMVSIMLLAGVIGTNTLCSYAMGGSGFPDYPGSNAASFDVTEVWDSLDLDDADTLEKYIMEVGRLGPTVPISHRVSTEPFSCVIRGRSCTFPRGTKIAIPLGCGNLDPAFWGPTAYEFDMHREGLVENFMGFNSLGDQSAGRECPGKRVALETISEVLRRLGRIRRNSSRTIGAEGSLYFVGQAAEFQQDDGAWSPCEVTVVGKDGRITVKVDGGRGVNKLSKLEARTRLRIIEPNDAESLQKVGPE